MTEAMTKASPPPTMTERDVVAWLKANPDFLSAHPEIVDFLLPPRENKGKGVADFQYYMVQRLKADRDEVIDAAREVVATSRANMNNQTRIHRAVLMLLEARNFEDFIRTITIDFAALLDTDIVSLIVETEDGVIPQIHMQGVRAVTPGTVALLMKDRQMVLESGIAGMDELYGGGAGLVKSQALLRLHIGTDAPPAMIAFGSRNPEMFQPGQGIELVTFLGHVVERCFGAWLHIPE